MSDSDASEFCTAGSDSRITRYWLDWVKIVETMRWPKASYSALSIVAEVMPKRAAVSRSTTTVADRPRSMKLVETFSSAGDADILWISFGTHSVSVAELASSSTTWYCARLTVESIVRSWTGCR